MSRYANQSLFDTGPHAFHVHGLSQRHVTHEQPGTDGVRLTAMGRTGRTIEQTGSLLADDLAGMQQQLDAIEAAMTGDAGELIDDLDRTWADVVMLEFKPEPIRRVGVRLAVDYRVKYSQVTP